MAVFDESKVINALHPEKAEVGKKYWYSDSIVLLKKHVENNNSSFVGEFDSVKSSYYFMTNGISWNFLYPYEEPPKQRMTNRQLAEWLAKGNGEYRHVDDSYTYSYYVYDNRYANNEVYDRVIRPWDSEEWVEPTVDIYERDCKGGE